MFFSESGNTVVNNKCLIFYSHFETLKSTTAEVNLELGKLHLEPESKYFLGFKSKVRSLRKINQMPKINFNDLHSIEKIEDGQGFGFKALYKAIYKGKSVFIKFSKREAEYSFNEAKNSYLLNKLGLGPEFYGIVEKEGAVGIVTEYIEGIHFSEYKIVPSEIAISEKTALAIEHTGQLLFRAGFLNTYDIQFRINKLGEVFIIDTEFIFDETLPSEEIFLQSPIVWTQRQADSIRRQIVNPNSR